MATTTFVKVSGVLVITQTTGRGNYYGATAVASAKFKPSNDGTKIYLTVGNDAYEFGYTSIQVNGQTPTTLSTALTLLNSIFGS